MIPLLIGCVFGGCLDVPVNVNNREPWEQVAAEFGRQNPPKMKNPSCYIDGEFYKSCPEDDGTDW